jgi:hypothetical protein
MESTEMEQRRSWYNQVRQSAMKPTAAQYFLAAHGVKLAAGIGATILPIVVAFACGGFSIWAVLAVLCAVPLGCVLGFLFFSPLIGVIACKMNGGPFRLGDVVRVLVGRHRDRVGHIYTMWTERNQARVDLGEEARKDTTDVFGYDEICRETDA